MGGAIGDWGHERGLVGDEKGVVVYFELLFHHECRL